MKARIFRKLFVRSWPRAIWRRRSRNAWPKPEAHGSSCRWFHHVQSPVRKFWLQDNRIYWAIFNAGTRKMIYIAHAIIRRLTKPIHAELETRDTSCGRILAAKLQACHRLRSSPGNTTVESGKCSVWADELLFPCDVFTQRHRCGFRSTKACGWYCACVI